ncbi:hypothetical protein DI09_6p130 [Mitosporidium daphniae]|uniref:Uncharacterized protein n=1 Tax=Mitosporidium daphniae TaxID=1485682 RepID=A0A098VNS9_9MICR|nr:uncharacterized protein DI09_86p90 [Mitosporidium daphniae]XP_013236856.1 uncharacterized protein DI09_6p130 [Mitosporidium daphniae]KGG50145.1 hypothetical protein DI09_86p90 [Mitosporidium daphniae]KGG50429.1 hypothetical protein DI09_6p130 [Mitosporidium daphniae]|eukprot:XP_013236585.1 uncharacterized protein DI09_86p90 [Mitosporidium daphniae]
MSDIRALEDEAKKDLDQLKTGASVSAGSHEHANEAINIHGINEDTIVADQAVCELGNEDPDRIEL